MLNYKTLTVFFVSDGGLSSSKIYLDGIRTLKTRCPLTNKNSEQSGTLTVVSGGEGG